MYKLKLGKSLSVFLPDFSERLEEAKKLGYDAMDFDLCAYWTDREKEKLFMTKENLVERLEEAKDSRLILNAVHIPFGPHWDVSSPTEEKRSEAVKNIEEILPVIDAYNPKCYVLHGSFEPISDEDRCLHFDALKKSLAELIRKTKSVFALEILPRTCLLNTSSEAVAFTDEFASEQVKICMDVNHLLREKSEDAVLRVGSRIITTHISDHDYTDERHWMPKKGKIDWMKLIGAFENIGYQGVFNYETQAGSLKEIKENYESLFASYEDEKGKTCLNG